MRAMFREIGILVKEDLSNGIDNEAVNLMINSISNLDINLSLISLQITKMKILLFLSTRNL